MRIKQKLAVCVFRFWRTESVLHLEAKTRSGKKFYRNHCPQSVLNCMKDGNLFEIECTMNPDGSNIRSCKYIKELSDQDYQQYDRE